MSFNKKVDLEAATATIVAALRTYQREGYGNPDRRPDDIQELAVANENMTSLDDKGIDELCEALCFGDNELIYSADGKTDSGICSPIRDAIEASFKRHMNVLHDDYSPRDLNGDATFSFRVDGLKEELSFDGTLYAAWCANLNGALNLDWGWGWGEVVASVEKFGYYVEHNDLNYVSETFKYLNETFCGALAQAPADFSPGNELYDKLEEHMLGSAWYDVSWEQQDYKLTKEEFVTQYSEFAEPYVKQLIAMIQGDS